MPAKRWRSRANRSRIRPHRSGRRGLFVDSADFDALAILAEAKMPPASWAFCAAGADDEITANENIAAWRALRLKPRVLNDVGNVDLRTSLLGGQVSSPIVVAPRRRHGGSHLCDGVEFQRHHRGGRRRAQSRAAMVPTLLLAEPRRGRGVDR